MAHDHPAGRGGGGAQARPIALTLGLVVLYMGVEVVGGLVSGSLALLADAGHMLSDAGALALTLFAMHVARRPPTARRTFGSYRAEILAALVNGATLVAIAVFIVVEACERIREPPAVAGPLMFAVACGGLVVNGGGLWIMRGGRGGNLNVRGAWLHVLTDALGSLQAIVAGGLIWAFGWAWMDPLASVLIAVLVIYSAWSLIARSVAVLMESTPGHVDLDEVRAGLASIPGVTGVHDLHVWTISSNYVALSAHVTCGEPGRHDAILRAAAQVLGRFGIRHSTIQVEHAPWGEHVSHSALD
jgi:cobalt-zinc-cadmium efflux system protein